MTRHDTPPHRHNPRSTLAKTLDDVAHLAAHFAMLYGSGAVLVNTDPKGNTRGAWMLRVDTVEGPIAWPIRDRDLILFDRVARAELSDPRTKDVAEAADHRNPRLEALTDVAWGDVGGLTNLTNLTGERPR